jgi:hypothetical protein
VIGTGTKEIEGKWFRYDTKAGRQGIPITGLEKSVNNYNFPSHAHHTELSW